MKLRRQWAFHSGTGFVSRPKIVAKRFDHMIGGDSDGGRAIFNHLGEGIQNAGNRAEWRISFMKPPQSVEVAEKFVGAVDEMNDHDFSTKTCATKRHKKHKNG